MATIPSGGAGGGAGTGGSGWVKIADVDVPGGTVTNRVFQDPPNNTILQSATVSGTGIDLTVRSSYPIVDINGTLYTLPESADSGHYQDTVSLTIPGTGPVTVTALTGNGEAGAVDASDLTVELPAELTALSFTGGYPGAQTEVKENDTFDITGTTDKDIDRVRVLEYEACQLQEYAVAVGTSFTISGIIADRGTTGIFRPARVQVRDAVSGAWSSTRDTNFGGGSVNGVNVVLCNNLHPFVNIGAITYPGIQQALKNSESASVAVTAANYDTITPSSPPAELNISGGPPSYTAQRVSGSYNVSTNNFRLTATRNANGAQTIAETVVQIANVAPIITVVTPAVRLRSGGNNGTSAQDHVIQLQSDQLLLNSPTLNEDPGGNRGTFLGSWSGGPSTWTRSLQVDETVPDEKGTFAWSGLVATGLAGIVQNTIGTGPNYTLGGFVQRDLTFAAFATTTLIGTSVEDFSKLTAGIFTATNQTAIKQAIGTPPPVLNGYTINAIGTNPTNLVWLDTAAASSNSSGTAQITDVEETV
jgi:hypothetical protein